MNFNKLPTIVKNLTPDFLRTARISFLNSQIKKKFLEANHNTEDADIRAIIEYLQDNPFSCYPYKFTQKYKAADIVIQTAQNGQRYVITAEGYKLFFPISFSPKEARGFYNWILMEQDPESPHKYTGSGFFPQENAIVLDIGAAEGLFALSAIDRSKKIFILEKDKGWLSALYQTFDRHNIGPLADKVNIVEKYLDKTDSEETIALSSLCKEYRNDHIFIKMDIEGMEYDVLKNSEEFLKNASHISIAVACYHYQEDADRLANFLSELGFNVAFTDGYILTHMNGIKYPYYRKCVLRAFK